ncbi:MAG: hypothetical protein KJZ59_00380 [Pararhodobacter sp.]|nr:hypothetical protein [Pararhodobacter sp.]
MRHFGIFLFVALCGTGVLAQTQTVEQLRQQIDARVNALNPYQELLADPDPDRSLAAMEIMLASGDPVLMNMALEFGFLSNNPKVREMALTGFLTTGPSLTLEFDLSVTESEYVRRILLGVWQGAAGDNQRVYATWRVGPYNPATMCYEFHGYEGQCFLRITAAGVAVSGSDLSGQLTNDGSGQLVGSVSIGGRPTAIPMRVSLMR